MMKYCQGPQHPLLIADASKHMTEMPNFHVDYYNSTKMLISRQMKVFLRNKAFVRSRFIMVVVMGLLYGSTFYQVDPQNPVVVIGVVFTAVLFLALGQIPLIPAAVDARNIFYKQRSANFFRTSSYILAQSFQQVPFAIGETLFFGSIMYWMTGFIAEAGAFLIYLLLLFVTNLSFAAWFFFVAVASSDLHVAKPIAMMSILVYITFSGFVISPSIMPDYFIWIYWIDPLSWCIRAVSINQYSAQEFQQATYGGIPYKLIKGDTMGNVMLKTFGLKTDRVWIWYGAIYLLGTYFFFMCLSYIALEYNRHDAPENVSVTLDNNGEEHDSYALAPKTPVNNQPPSVEIHVAGSSTSSPPVTLAFKDLWYSVPNPTKGEPDLQLLKGINGYALPGTITALMGSSGAGKTTLMDVIAGRKT
ncbi:ATP-binding Cassette (ABC) Superfamily, partial [Thraustotheca clavata]